MNLFSPALGCTKSAFCQARKKLKLSFFEDFFTQTIISYYNHTSPLKYKGYRIWACATSVQLLPDSEANRQIGIHKNQFKEVASVKISAYFDVYQELITQVGLFDKRTCDLLCCLDKQVQKVPKDVIAIYDRGYGSQILPYFHNLHGSKFVIRLKTTHSKTVKTFVESDAKELFITEPLTERTYKRLENYGIRSSGLDKISYRLIKVVLPTNEVEVLLTNLNASFSVEDLSALYHLRWGIETCFGGLKNHQMLGTFSGYSPKSVKQDIWCNLIFYNLQSITSMAAKAKAKQISYQRAANPRRVKKKANKGYKLNRNVGTNTLRMHLYELFTCSQIQLQQCLKSMTDTYVRSLEMIKETNRERKRKMLRQNDRHFTERNYKRGF